MKRLRGAGLPNVFLVNGFTEEPSGATSYLSLEELYQAIAGAIAMRSGALTGPELRFLRKRLDMTQDEVAALGDKSAQAVAKWEKGQAPVPLAESTLIRLVWLERNSRRHIAAAVRALMSKATDPVSCDYVMHYVEGVGWQHDARRAHASIEVEAHEAITRAMTVIGGELDYKADFIDSSSHIFTKAFHGNYLEADQTT